jgi:hypothetical protein
MYNIFIYRYQILVHAVAQLGHSGKPQVLNGANVSSSRFCNSSYICNPVPLPSHNSYQEFHRSLSLLAGYRGGKTVKQTRGHASVWQVHLKLTRCSQPFHVFENYLRVRNKCINETFF